MSRPPHLPDQYKEVVFPDSKTVKLNCNCSDGAPGDTALELGPLWAGDIFDVEFLDSVITNKRTLDPKVILAVSTMLEEARQVLVK